ncbi:hypothetical protein [Salinibacter grassmerensis]|uniref:hypothetical protein n=1 Tax=Salinibacter grassmerensis TaxID=3040353 RepID=UPI0021E8D75C|nr:hypothetical protein [Salinibacter grassmerensis]
MSTRDTASPVTAADASSWRRMLRRYWRARGVAWGALIVACIGSRLATTITYIEDPDSLRFALSVADEYDIAALQPHFPGYPVFWAATELFYLPTGSFSTSFSLVGGFATVGLVWALLRLWDRPLCSVEGAALAGVVVLNPLLWLMANRYMPDFLGTAWAVATLAVLLRAGQSEGRAGQSEGRAGRRAALVGIALAGLLAGLRLSYLPLVVVPSLLVLWRSDRPIRLVAAGVAGVGVWLVPMVLDTGLWTLIDVAWGQTTGHFADFGGTVQTESDLGRRLAGTVQGLWADGLGGWWPGRHWSTLLVGTGVLGVGISGLRRMVQTGAVGRRRARMLVVCAAVYGAWMFFFQNVVHKSRHVLPLLALLLPVLAAGAATWWRTRSWPVRGAVLAVAGAYAAVTFVLVDQHRDPSAIAQAKGFVENTARTTSRPTRVASVPLVNTYLQTQQVGARFLSIEDSSDVRRLRETEAGRTLVVGTYASLIDQAPTRTRTFYHNPHVNRMWPKVTVYVYEH